MARLVRATHDLRAGGWPRRRRTSLSAIAIMGHPDKPGDDGVVVRREPYFNAARTPSKNA